jgi:hypothetical protein
MWSGRDLASFDESMPLVMLTLDVRAGLGNSRCASYHEEYRISGYRLMLLTEHMQHEVLIRRVPLAGASRRDRDAHLTLDASVLSTSQIKLACQLSLQVEKSRLILSEVGAGELGVRLKAHADYEVLVVGKRQTPASAHCR